MIPVNAQLACWFSVPLNAFGPEIEQLSAIIISSDSEGDGDGDVAAEAAAPAEAEDPKPTEPVSPAVIVTQPLTQPPGTETDMISATHTPATQTSTWPWSNLSGPAEVDEAWSWPVESHVSSCKCVLNSKTLNHMGCWQNYGPFSNPYYSTAPI